MIHLYVLHLLFVLETGFIIRYSGFITLSRFMNLLDFLSCFLKMLFHVPKCPKWSYPPVDFRKKTTPNKLSVLYLPASADDCLSFFFNFKCIIKCCVYLSRVREEWRWTHGPRGRLLAKSSYVLSIWTKGKKCNILFLPVKSQC